MIHEFSVKNFAIIDQLRTVFSPGLNILTGETGAGKTIIVEAINLILGGKADTRLIRSGEDYCEAEGLFRLKHDNKDLISAIVGEEIEDEVIITRRVYRDKSSKSYFNGRAIPVKKLQQIGVLLVDIHGQHQHQSLLDVNTHLPLLDGFGQERFKKEIDRFSKKTYEEYIGLLKEIQKAKTSSESVRELKELYEFQIGEIEKAGLKKGEEKDLDSRREILKNRENIINTFALAKELLKDKENSATSILFETEEKFSQIAQVDKKINELHKRIKDMSIELDEIGLEITQFLSGFEFQEGVLSEIEERLDLIARLKEKYNARDCDQIISYKDKIKSKLDTVEDRDEALKRLERKKEGLEERLLAEGKALSRKRKEIAEKLEKGVKEELKMLGMVNADFKVDIKKKESGKESTEGDLTEVIGKKGFDVVEFLISPNRGEPLKPLSKIASGGEISRIMLAFKKILAKADRIHTLIFDEIDVGIGGKTAYHIGNSLKTLSNDHQIICLTHLPQIACFAEEHFHVYKVVSKGRTKTHINKLDEEERVEEIARMLSGKAITKDSKKTASDLISSASKYDDGQTVKTF